MYILESHLDKSVLQNTFNSRNLPDSMEVGDYRARMFLHKVENNLPFKLVGGEEVYVSPKSPGMKDILDILNKKSVSTVGKFIVASDPEAFDESSDQIPLSKFEKTADFGSSNQTTGGSTEDVERLTALFCALRAKLNEPLVPGYALIEKLRNIELDNLRVSENSDKLLDKAEELLMGPVDDPWLHTYIATANTLAEEGWLLPGMEVYREGNYVDGIYESFRRLNKRYSNRNKWNPADIWLRKPGFALEGTCQSLAELNTALLNAVKNRELVGVSLKALKKGKPKIQEFNFDPKELDTSHQVTVEDLEKTEWVLTANTSNSLKVGKYKITFRCSQTREHTATGFMAEVSNQNAAARNGKAGLPAINYELGDEDELPSMVELSKQFPDYSGAQLSKAEANLFYERFTKKPLEEQLRIINGLLDYAMSKTSDASAFIKIS